MQCHTRMLALTLVAACLGSHWQTVWIKLFGNANEQTKNMFKNRFQIRSTPSLIVFKGKEVGGQCETSLWGKCHCRQPCDIDMRIAATRDWI